MSMHSDHVEGCRERAEACRRDGDGALDQVASDLRHARRADRPAGVARPAGHLPLALAVGAAFLAVYSTVAGPLNPPDGPVAPTYKTLVEVEPRTAINAANTPGDADSLFRITQPGSYYLTANVTGVAGKHGIEIASGGVTIDLRGFDLAGVSGMGPFDGVSLPPASIRNVTILNGSIRNWGGDGIDLSFTGGDVTNCRIEGVTANGNAGVGIRAGTRAGTITNCIASANGAVGILVGHGYTITNCSVSNNTGNGIQAASSTTVTGCSASDNDGSGIFIDGGSTATNCSSSSNAQHGFIANSNCTFTACTSHFNGFDGIRVLSDCYVYGCTLTDNGTAGQFAGIFINGNRNRIERNHIVTTDAGVSAIASATGNVIIGNYAGGGGANDYLLPASGNFIGTIVGTSAGMNSATNSTVNISN
jgi:hypothetical protein